MPLSLSEVTTNTSLLPGHLEECPSMACLIGAVWIHLQRARLKREAHRLARYGKHERL
ncbi:MAG: hypothetical protein ACFCVA_06285 [Gammaproteobacteria bacterium]